MSNVQPLIFPSPNGKIFAIPALTGTLTHKQSNLLDYRGSPEDKRIWDQAESGPSEADQVQLYNMSGGGTDGKIFTSLSVYLTRIRLTKAQVCHLIEGYPGILDDEPGFTLTCLCNLGGESWVVSMIKKEGRKLMLSTPLQSVFFCESDLRHAFLIPVLE